MALHQFDKKNLLMKNSVQWHELDHIVSLLRSQSPQLTEAHVQVIHLVTEDNAPLYHVGSLQMFALILHRKLGILIGDFKWIKMKHLMVHCTRWEFMNLWFNSSRHVVIEKFIHAIMRNINQAIWINNSS